MLIIPTYTYTSTHTAEPGLIFENQKHMHSKPLNRETFLGDIAGCNALVTCRDIDTACELIKAAFAEPSGVNVTFTTDQEEALDTASYKQSKSLVFTLGSEDTVTTF